MDLISCVKNFGSGTMKSHLIILFYFIFFWIQKQFLKYILTGKNVKIILLRYYLLCVHSTLILSFFKFYFIFKLSDGNGGTVRLVLLKKKYWKLKGTIKLLLQEVEQEMMVAWREDADIEESSGWILEIFGHIRI